MTELVIAFYFGVFVMGVVEHIYWSYRLNRLKRVLTDFYYDEHIYPMMKVNKFTAVQRELAWKALMDEIRKR